VKEPAVRRDQNYRECESVLISTARVAEIFDLLYLKNAGISTFSKYAMVPCVPERLFSWKLFISLNVQKTVVV
jgi:hypothetical protein